MLVFCEFSEFYIYSTFAEVSLLCVAQVSVCRLIYLHAKKIRCACACLCVCAFHMHVAASKLSYQVTPTDEVLSGGVRQERLLVAV